MIRWSSNTGAAVVGALLSSGLTTAFVSWLMHSGAWGVTLSVSTIVLPLLALTGSLHLLALALTQALARRIPPPLSAGVISAGLMLAYIAWMQMTWNDNGHRLLPALWRVKEEVAVVVSISGVGGVAAGTVAVLVTRWGRKPAPGPEISNE